jgi:hypothetical protein
MTVDLITTTGRYHGISSDSKPTVGINRGSEFFEEDTGFIYKFTGATWVRPAIKTLAHDASGNPIGSLGGGLNIHDAHVHSSLINHFVFTKDGYSSSTLDGNVLAGDRTITLVDGSGFAAGNYIDMLQGTSHVHHWRKIIAVSVNDITIDAPADIDFASGSSVEEGSADMGVNGSVTPVIFSVTPQGDEILHIGQLLVTIESSAAADDSKFGGLPALTNGVVVRVSRNNGAEFETLSTWRTNKDLKEDMYLVVYSDKAGGGNYGVHGKWNLEESGAISKIDETNNDKFEVVIQDNLTSLVDFQIKVQGHPEG